MIANFVSIISVMSRMSITVLYYKHANY